MGLPFPSAAAAVAALCPLLAEVTGLVALGTCRVCTALALLALRGLGGKPSCQCEPISQMGKLRHGALGCPSSCPQGNKGRVGGSGQPLAPSPSCWGAVSQEGHS